MATQTAARLVSTLTLPDGKATRETLDKEEERPCFTLASGQMVWAAFSVTVTWCHSLAGKVYGQWVFSFSPHYSRAFQHVMVEGVCVYVCV